MLLGLFKTSLSWPLGPPGIAVFLFFFACFLSLLGLVRHYYVSLIDKRGINNTTLLLSLLFFYVSPHPTGSLRVQVQIWVGGHLWPLPRADEDLYLRKISVFLQEMKYSWNANLLWHVAPKFVHCEKKPKKVVWTGQRHFCLSLSPSRGKAAIPGVYDTPAGAPSPLTHLICPNLPGCGLLLPGQVPR